MQSRDEISDAARQRLARLEPGVGAPPVIRPPVIPPPLPRTSAATTAPSRPPPLRVVVKADPLLRPEELDRFKNLLVFAQSVVEGYFSGKHKSPFRGSSAEFADYKEYVAGDDVGHIDWRVYGRSRRLYLRQFEEETDMALYVLVDTSGSMRYSGEGRQSKYILAAKIAAALSYLMIQQGDKVALGLFAEKLAAFVQPGGTRRHLHRIVSELERIQPALKTGLPQALAECGSVLKRRGKLIVISDFLTETEPLLDALSQFVHRKFDILLLQVLDPDEINLPAVDVAKFLDMETGEEVQVEPDEIRRAYRENMMAFIDALAREADARRISHALVDTRNPYLHAIEAYLGFRGRIHSS
jgi:uncharacterized protein (DUF58 family)